MMCYFDHVKVVLCLGAAVFFTGGIAWAITTMIEAMRRKKPLPPKEPEEEVRPKHIPLTYSWDDWIKDIYSAGVSTDLIMEKIRWCGMPKRPKPEPTKVVTGTASTIGTPFVGGVPLGGGTGIGGGTIGIQQPWVGGMVYPSTTGINPNPWPNTNIYSSGVTYFPPHTINSPYSSSFANTTYCTYSNVNVSNCNSSSFTFPRTTFGEQVVS